MNMVNLRESHVYLSNNINRANINNLIYNDYYVGEDNIFETRTTPEDPILYQSQDAEVELDDSGASNPSLWKSSSPDHDYHQQSHYCVNRSPASRIQEIVRGQRELMEMVSTMPEGSYELSLKDMVETRESTRNDGEDHEEEEDEVRESKDNYSEEKSVYNEEIVLMQARQEERETKKRKTLEMRRTGSPHHHHYANNNSGGAFLLKMFFPKITWGARNKSKTKKKNEMIEIRLSDGRVSPRPLLLDGSPLRTGGGADKEWWRQRKRLASSGKSSESGGGEGFNTTAGSSKSSGSSSSSIDSNKR